MFDRITCRLFCFVMMICCFAVLTSATVSKAAPVAVLEAAAYDFGTTLVGSNVIHDFIVKNTGDVDLEIKSVNPG